jgi:hypothetical protein
MLPLVLQQCFAAMFGIKAGLFNFGTEAPIISFRHVSHSAGEVACCSRVICCGVVHQIEQPPALAAEFQVVNRPHIGS